MDPLEMLKRWDEKTLQRFRSSSCAERYLVGTLLRPLNRNGSVSYGKRTFRPFAEVLKTSEDTLRDCIKVAEAFPDVEAFKVLAKKRWPWSHFVLLSKLNQVRRDRTLGFLLTRPMTTAQLKARIAETASVSAPAQDAINTVLTAAMFSEFAYGEWVKGDHTDADQLEMEAAVKKLAGWVTAINRIL